MNSSRLGKIREKVEEILKRLEPSDVNLKVEIEEENIDIENVRPGDIFNERMKTIRLMTFYFKMKIRSRFSLTFYIRLSYPIW